jgi:hypothetical protein
MLVNRLPFVVVIRVVLAIRAGYRLRRFVGLESQIPHLMIVRILFIAKTVVAKHQVIVSLQVLGIDLKNRIQHLHGVSELALEEEHST